MSATDGFPLGAEEWRDVELRTQLRRALNSGLVGQYSIELAIGVTAGVLDAFAAGADSLTEAQEIALMRLLEGYRSTIRELNVRTAQARIADL